MSVEHATAHPLLAGFEQTRQIVNARRSMDVEAAQPFARPPLTRIPSYPTDPMEQIYPRTPRTDIAEIYAREIGPRSRVVYFPGDVDATFAAGGAPDLARLLANAVRWAANTPGPVQVEGPGLLEVVCWRQADSLTVHMLNGSNPFMLRSAYREDIPLGAQTISIRVPEGATVRDVKLLVSEMSPEFHVSGDVLTLTAPSVVDHEVVAVDFA